MLAIPNWWWRQASCAATTQRDRNEMRGSNDQRTMWSVYVDFKTISKSYSEYYQTHIHKYTIFFHFSSFFFLCYVQFFIIHQQHFIHMTAMAQHYQYWRHV